MKRSNIKNTAWLLLMLLCCSHAMRAQSGYDPATPPEPYQRYKVAVGVNENAAGYVSGGGTYTVGTSVYINTSSRGDNYSFVCWMKNGERYTTSMSFNYIVDDAVQFVAVYEFTPSLPAEPSGIYSRRLYLESSMDEACSFSLANGTKVNENTNISVSVYPNSGFVFQGWYEGSTLLSTSTTLSYHIGNSDARILAKFVYDPMAPADPCSATGDVDNPDFMPGDVNGDGSVTIADAIGIVNNILKKESASFNASAADVNGDGSITIADAIGVVNIILRKTGDAKVRPSEYIFPQ